LVSCLNPESKSVPDFNILWECIHLYPNWFKKLIFKSVIASEAKQSSVADQWIASRSSGWRTKKLVSIFNFNGYSSPSP
jgi:hypothetical protein